MRSRTSRWISRVAARRRPASAGRAASVRSSGSRWVCTSATPGPRANRLLDPLGDLVRRARSRSAGNFRCSDTLTRSGLLEDRDVVGFLDQRLGQRDREDTVAQVQAAAARLDVHDDVAAGQRALDGLLDEVGGPVSLDHRLPGRHA